MFIDDYGWKKYLRIKRKYMSTKSELIRSVINQSWKHHMMKYSAWIPLATKIAENVTFPHGIHGVFISSHAKIGDGVTIFQQVTIGSNTLKESKGIGSPVIEENCYIGAGAKIIGNVHIGRGVRIGANCVVTEDIPDYATVVMEKPRIIIHEKYRDNEFVSINQM